MAVLSFDRPIPSLKTSVPSSAKSAISSSTSISVVLVNVTQRIVLERPDSVPRLVSLMNKILGTSPYDDEKRT